MKKHLHSILDEGYPFVLTVLAIAVMPLIPEYGAPVLAIFSLFTAHKDARARGTELRIGVLGKLLLIYIAYMAIGILYSDHKGNSFATLLMWLVMFLVYVSLGTVLVTRKRIRIALGMVAVAAGLVGLVACGQHLLRSVLGFSSLPNQFWYRFDRFFYNYFPMDIDLTLGDDRAAGTFNNPNILGEYLVMVIPLVGYYGFFGKRTKAHILGRLCTILAVFGAVVSFSRGAYIALLSMLLLIVFMHARKISPFVMCLLAAVSLVPEAVIGRLFSIGQGGDAIFERFEAWEVAVQVIIKNPLFGLGPGVSNFWEQLTKMGVSAPHSHNLILQILVEGGFIALFLMCLVATHLLQDSLGLLNRSNQSAPTGRIFLIFAVAFVVYGMVDYPFLSPKLIGTFCLVLGFFDCMSALYLPNRFTPLSKLLDPLIKYVKALPKRLKKQ